MSLEIKNIQRLLAWPVCLGWLHSSLFALHRWYLDELCCQKHAGTRKGVFPPHVGCWEQLPGEPRAQQRKDGDGSGCQAPAKSSELMGREKKSWSNLQTEQIGEETHRRQLHLEC